MKPRLTIHTLSLLVGAVVVGASLCTTTFLALNPQWMLVIEEYQPGASIQRGLSLLREGEDEKAMQAFQRGYEYFNEIFERTNLPRHRKQVVLALHGQAHIHKNRAFIEDWREAEALYRQAIQLEPDWTEGQPYLSLGEVYLSLGENDQAIEQFSLSFEHGYGRFSLKSNFGRGAAYLASGDHDRAADDFYAYIRYFDGSIPQYQWQTMSTIDPAQTQNVKALFVAGVANSALGNTAEAEELLGRYHASVPNDPAAAFFRSNLLADPALLVESVGNIRDHAYSAVQHPGEKFSHLYIDVYRSASPVTNLSIELSGTSSGEESPAVEVLVDRQLITTLTPVSPSPTIYNVSIPTTKPKVILELREPLVIGVPPQADLFLHSLRVDL